MEAFETEEQRLDAIKSWWKENGMSVVLGAALGLLAIAGYKYYQQWQSGKAEAASHAYLDVLKLSEDAAKASEFKQKTESLVADHAGTVYAQFGQLFLARDAVKANELDRAIGLLQDVVNNAKHPAIKHVATLRLARVRLAKGDAEAALKLVQVDKQVAGEYAGLYALTRGQVLLKLNREADAHAAFNEAQEDKDMAGNSPALPFYVDGTMLPPLAAESAK